MTVNATIEYQWKANADAAHGGQVLLPRRCSARWTCSRRTPLHRSPRRWRSVRRRRSRSRCSVTGVRSTRTGTTRTRRTSCARSPPAARGLPSPRETTDIPRAARSNYGDLQQTGADTGVLFGRSFWGGVGQSLPLFPAIGNHGLGRDGDAQHRPVRTCRKMSRSRRRAGATRRDPTAVSTARRRRATRARGTRSTPATPASMC